MFISDPPRKDDAKAAVGFISVKLAEVAAFGEGLPMVWFDYGTVPKENRAELQQIAADVKNDIRQQLAAIVRAGESLLRSKKIAGHGNFLPWLAHEFSWSERTARMYMRVAEFFQGKTATFADLDLTTATALIKAPPDVRDKIMARAAAGESIPRAEVKAAVARVKPQPKPKPAANVVWVPTSTRQLAIPTIGYVRGPASAPEESVLAVEASDVEAANGELTPFRQILMLLPSITDDEYAQLRNIVAGEQPTRARQ